MGEVVALVARPALGDAIRMFLYSYERIGSEGTRTTYRTALHQMAAAFPSLDELDSPAGAARFEDWFRGAFAGKKPRTYATKMAICRSAFNWWRRQGWMVVDPTAGLIRPGLAGDRTRVHDRAEVERLWERSDLPLRVRALAKMLYETAARCHELLRLNVEDLDLVNKRAKVRRKGGGIDWVFWQTGTAHLLPRLLAGRSRGPLFLTDRKPTRAVANLDLCPVTGRARLSYRRAHELLTAYGFRPHDFRRDSLTHDAENGTSVAILMARSGHRSLRSLEPYVKPSAEAVARHVAEMDPGRR